MAQPRDYNRQYNFNDFQTTSPSDPLPGNEVDNELNSVKLTLDDLNENIEKIQRDDGKLKNQAVHKDAFDAGALALVNAESFNPRGDWTAGRAYAVNDIIDFNGATYLATVAHTSAAAFATDLDADRWVLLANAAIATTAAAVDKYEGDGAQTVFTLQFNYASDTSAMVFVNGALRNPGDDYTISGNTLTFVTAPSTPSVAGNENVIVFGASVVAQAAKEAAEAARDNSESYRDTAQDWASKVNGDVDSSGEYSSKAYAVGGTGVDAGTGSAKDWATKTNGTVGNTGEYSAKYYATDANVGTVATNITDVNTVAGEISPTNNISTVASRDADIGTVATRDADIGTVAARDADVGTVASRDADIGTVAARDADIGTVAARDADVGTVATDSADIQTLAAISTDITSLANSLGAITTYTVTVAQSNGVNVYYLDGAANPTLTFDRGNTYIFDLSDNSNSGHPLEFKDASGNSYTTGVTTTGAAGQSGGQVQIDVDNSAPASLRYYCTVHGNAMGNTITVVNSNLALVASNITNVNNVGSDITNVNLVAGSITNVDTVATNLTDVNAFAETYFIGATQPASPTNGDLWFDTSSDTMKVYGSSGFQNAGSSVNGTSNRYQYLVGTTSGSYTGSTTVFPATYDSGFVDVYRNGIKLIVGASNDFVATNGTSITLNSAATTGDTIDIVAYGTFTLNATTLDDLAGVTVASPSSGQFLKYDGNNWVGDNVPAGVGGANGVDFDDNVKAQFGAGNDLQIFHNGSNSIIKDGGTGDLQIRAQNLHIKTPDGVEDMARFLKNGAVNLYHDNTKKFETTSTGISITGDVSATGNFVGSGGLKSQQVFTSSGTWTKPAGINTIKVFVTGGGGGGGGHGAANDMGAGGGAGGTAIEIIDVSSVSSVTVTIGSGGAGASGGYAGSAGGTSSFGSYCSATGGGGGDHGNDGNGTGGTGGTGSGGDINIIGGSGGNGWDNFDVNAQYARGFGFGGASYWGGGGHGSSYSNFPSESGRAYGSGGGAPHSTQGGTAGAGKIGIIVVEEYA